MEFRSGARVRGAVCLALAAALALTGCVKTTRTVAGKRIMQVVPQEVQMQSVEKVYAWCFDGKLRVQAYATAWTPGWRGTRLRPLKMSGNQIVFQAVGVMPKYVRPGEKERTFVIDYEGGAQGVEKVRVTAQKNALESDVQMAPCTPARPFGAYY